MSQIKLPMLNRRMLLASVAMLGLPRVVVAQVPTPLPPPQAPAMPLDDRTARGFRRDVVIRWGDRVEPDSPPFAPNMPTADAAARQFGWDAIVLGMLPVPAGEDGVPRALLAVAHPSGAPRMMFPGGLDHPVAAVLGQGASILNLERHDDLWLITDGGYQTRRITGRTLCRISGPMTPVLGEAAQGVLSINAGNVTPWATLLMAEGDAEPWFARLPGAEPTLPQATHKAAYGWMVELDPFDPQAMPTKRTALGRFARSGVVTAKSNDGRAVVFMSDDRAAGHLFRFVSTESFGDDSRDVLDNGTLSVAVLDGYTLRWIPLPDTGNARLGTLDAADKAGAALFDAPAGIAIDARGTILLACRGATPRPAPDPAYFGGGNRDGEVLILRPSGGDPAAAQFSIEIGLLGGDTGMEGAKVSHPTTLRVAADGRIWIATSASGVVVTAPGFGPPREVYQPPLGAVMGGIAFSPDNKAVFTAVRHPGATPGASFDRPATRWPTLRHDMPPQTTIISLTPIR